ncbi:hypothetical protein PR048_015759 [Dryococelus australis]|uniref:Uncharacterized protein n=1 Tax=Dryococelus australis TaxID=614101 RepID=A0ABQ9HHU4_9NEOP|nr:hypothetical protein PR048_015759 [Dryococelus australis]
MEREQGLVKRKGIKSKGSGVRDERHIAPKWNTAFVSRLPTVSGAWRTVAGQGGVSCALYLVCLTRVTGLLLLACVCVAGMRSDSIGEWLPACTEDVPAYLATLHHTPLLTVKNRIGEAPRLPPRRAGFRFLARSLPNFRMWESCRAMPLTLIGPQDLDVKSPQIPPLHSNGASLHDYWALASSHTHDRDGKLTMKQVLDGLACSPPTKANRVQSPAVSPNSCIWESCQTMPLISGFCRGSRVSPTPSFRRCSILTSITLISSQYLAESCRMMRLVGGFSRRYPVSPTFPFRHSSILTSIILIGSPDRDRCRHVHFSGCRLERGVFVCELIFDEELWRRRPARVKRYGLYVPSCYSRTVFPSYRWSYWT